MFEPILNKIQRDVYSINSIKNYLKVTHHAREFGSIKENEDLSNLIFTKRSTISPKSKILFQGDSWAEMNLHYYKSSKKINLIKDKMKYEIYEAGTTSYSLSLMTVQLNYLKENFDINPDLIIASIDHTDVADELCRYKNKTEINNNKIIKVNTENNYSKEIYNYKIDYHNKMENILIKNVPNILKIAEITLERLDYNSKQEKVMRCGTEEIIGYLKKKNLSEENLNYLERLANIYIDEVLNKNNDTLLLFVVHPWKSHYPANDSFFYWGDLIERVVSERKENQNIHILDFKKIYPDIYINNNIARDQIHIKGDFANHLTKKAHLIYLNQIFLHVENLLNENN